MNARKQEGTNPRLLLTHPTTARMFDHPKDTVSSRLVFVALVMAMPATATAQSASEITISTFDPENAVAPNSLVEGPGIRIGEGTVLHPVFGLQTGVISNVFHESTDPVAAGLLRLIAQVATASDDGKRGSIEGDVPKATQDLQYRASLRASYDVMLSGNDTVNETGGLGLGLTLGGVVNPQGKVAFALDEEFVRLIRTANFETDANTNRDINHLTLKLVFQPPGRSLSGYLYYDNTIDIFERDIQSFADRMHNRLGLRPMWRWLPQTIVFADVSQGINTGFGSGSTKVTSYPLVAIAGIATLLTLKTTLNFSAGYTNGFYSMGPSFSGLVLKAAAAYRYSPLGRVALTYDLMYEDSVNANYFRDHVIRLWVQQLFVPFVVMVQPEIHFRQYNGITAVMGAPVRNDMIYSVVAGVNYNFRNWIAATLNYSFSAVQTDYRYSAGGATGVDPSFVRHELLAGVRVAR
jgi:hypothetical protein